MVLALVYVTCGIVGSIIIAVMIYARTKVDADLFLKMSGKADAKEAWHEWVELRKAERQSRWWRRADSSR